MFVNFGLWNKTLYCFYKQTDYFHHFVMCESYAKTVTKETPINHFPFMYGAKAAFLPMISPYDKSINRPPIDWIISRQSLHFSISDRGMNISNGMKHHITIFWLRRIPIPTHIYAGGWRHNAVQHKHSMLLHGPLVGYVKLRVAHAPGMSGTLSTVTPPRVAIPFSSRHARQARAMMHAGIAT